MWRRDSERATFNLTRNDGCTRLWGKGDGKIMDRFDANFKGRISRD